MRSLVSNAIAIQAFGSGNEAFPGDTRCVSGKRDVEGKLPGTLGGTMVCHRACCVRVRLQQKYELKKRARTTKKLSLKTLHPTPDPGSHLVPLNLRKIHLPFDFELPGVGCRPRLSPRPAPKSDSGSAGVVCAAPLFVEGH